MKENMFAFACKYYNGKTPAACNNAILSPPSRDYRHYSDDEIHGPARKILFGSENQKGNKHCKNGKCIRNAPKGFKMAKKIKGTMRIKVKNYKNKKNSETESE